MLDSLPLSRKQLRSVAQAQARINLWHGAVRSGKTVASLLAFLLAVAEASRSGLIVIVGRSLQTIERNVLEPLADPALFGPVAAQVRHTRGATTAVILGRTVHLIGAADARAEGRLRGLTASLAYVDEATLLPEAFWTQLLARLSVPGAKLLATTNPDSPRHWLKAGYLDREHELDLRSWHFRLADNPSLSPAYVASLQAEYVGLWRRRMIDGAWVVAEGAIYDCWDEQQHVVDELPAMSRYWLGIDYGTTNPFAAILLGLGDDGRLYACAEWRYDSRARRRQMTDAQYSAALRGWLDALQVEPEWTFIDPSAASFLAQLWEDGHPGVTRARNDVLDGIRSTSTALASGLLLVHRSCEGLLGELPGYSWDATAAAAGEDRPLKRDDHSADALRYVVHSTAAEWRYLISDLLQEVTRAAA
ncbi:PBSX family phage terminase large subunit [Streptomyces sp. NRRL B-24484]|uniref:PBSX family phage terminase large subunit n=1 Tax=Streptomyces sp. NRRL B-24484 TaxID=1463833 RepID=UPI0004C18ABB|nr:PBSX family phage terminase large subunit [Streptomyces sp. NRRL B-24484]